MTSGSRSSRRRASTPRCCSRRWAAASRRRSARTSRPPWRRLSAFNRWLEDDWGFDYKHRLIAAPMLSLADPDAACAELDSLIERGARIMHIRPGSGARPQRHLPLARQQAARSGLGPAGRGDRPGGVPPRRQRVQPVRGGAVGRQRHLRLRHRRRPQPRAGVRSGHPRHHRLAGRARRVHPPPDAAGGEHRERLRLAGPAGEAAEEAGQPDAVGLRRRPARHHPGARLDHAVLRGGLPRPRRPDRRRPHPVRVRLAPRRGPGPAARLREGARRLHRRRDAEDPAGQLPRAARVGGAR